MSDMTLFVPRHVQESRTVEHAEIVERRDPSAATRPIAYTSPTLPLVSEWDSDQAYRFGYIANVVAYRCVQLTAWAIAGVPLAAGPDRRRTTDQRPDSPLGRAFAPPPYGPAPKLTVRRLIAWTVAQKLVTGRYAWEIETDQADRPVALWPLVSARLDAYPSVSGTEWFRIFEYGQPGRSGKVRLTPDRVFYGWEPSLADFRQPESPLQAARYDLSLVTLADRYGIGFLRNNAVPATVVTTAAFPDDRMRQAFRRQWEGEFGGAANAGRTLFNEVSDGDGPVGDGIDVKVLGLSQKDARLADARKSALVEIAMVLGVPWSKLDASGRTFDNAEVEDRTWWEERLDPLMNDLEDHINLELAPRFGNEVIWFDRSKVRALRGRVKPVTAAASAPSLVQAQLMTVNEARADYGLPPLEDGDRFMSSTEIVALAGGAPPALEPPRAAPEATVENRDEPAPTVEQRAPTAVDVELRRARIWKASDAAVRTLEARWERAWRSLFARQAKAAVARLEGNRGKKALHEQRVPADDIFDEGFWRRESVEVAGGLFEDVTAASLTRLAAAFGVSFDVESEFVQAFITERTTRLAGQVTDTTVTAVREALAAGVAEGEAIPELADRVRHVFDVASTQRATVIARTEVIAAFNGSAFLGAQQLPADVVGGQEWIATRDGRVRPEHAAADGQVRFMDAPFDVGGEQLFYPGDPSGSSANTVQCRCTVAFLTPDEMAERAGARHETRMVDAEHAKRMLHLASDDADWLTWRKVLNTEVAA